MWYISRIKHEIRKQVLLSWLRGFKEIKYAMSLVYLTLQISNLRFMSCIDIQYRTTY